MLLASLLLAQVLSPVEVALPHVRALPEAQRFEALLPLVQARPTPALIEELVALAKAPQQREALTALSLTDPKAPPAVAPRPQRPAWAAALDPKAGGADADPLLLAQVHLWRGARAEALRAIKRAAKDPELRSEALGLASGVGAWEIALGCLEGAELSAQLDGLGEIAQHAIEGGAWGVLDKIASAMGSADYSEAEELAWADEWTDEPGGPPAEEKRGRVEERKAAIDEALGELARNLAERAPAKAAVVARRVGGAEGARLQADIVTELITWGHLKIAAKLAQGVDDPKPAPEEGCEGADCDPVEPEMVGTAARVEVIQAAFEHGAHPLAWATLRALKDPGGAAFEEQLTSALDLALPHAISGGRVADLERIARARLKTGYEAWRASLASALMEAGQLLPAMKVIAALEAPEARMRSTLQLVLLMEHAGLSLTPAQLTQLLKP